MFGWNRFFGRSRGAAPAVTFPVEKAVVPDRLTVRIHRHDIPTAFGTIPCWTYITRGLWAVGQKEIVFSLRRLPAEEPAGFPQEPLAFFANLLQLADQGRTVDAGGHTTFRSPSGFLGRTELVGVIYLPLEPLAGVEMPERGRSLTAVLLTPEEAEMVPTLGSYRLTTRLGRTVRYYPCPPWSERNRTPVLSPQEMETSLLGKVVLAYVPGAAVRMELSPQAPFTRAQDGSPAGEPLGVTLRLPLSARALFAEALEQKKPEWAFALLTDADPEANARLVWTPGQQGMQAIAPDDSDRSGMTGGFLLFVVGGDAQEGARVVEDGFGVMVTAETGQRLHHALVNGEPLAVAAENENVQAFHLEWLPVCR
jgi:hypothetical protein